MVVLQWWFLRYPALSLWDWLLIIKLRAEPYSCFIVCDALRWINSGSEFWCVMFWCFGFWLLLTKKYRLLTNFWTNFWTFRNKYCLGWFNNTNWRWTQMNIRNKFFYVNYYLCKFVNFFVARCKLDVINFKCSSILVVLIFYFT